MWATYRSTACWSKRIKTGYAVTIKSILSWDLRTIMVRSLDGSSTKMNRETLVLTYAGIGSGSIDAICIWITNMIVS